MGGSLTRPVARPRAIRHLFSGNAESAESPPPEQVTGGEGKDPRMRWEFGAVSARLRPDPPKASQLTSSWGAQEDATKRVPQSSNRADSGVRRGETSPL